MIKKFEQYINEDYFSKLANRKDNGVNRLGSDVLKLNYQGRILSVPKSLFEGTAADSYSDDNESFDTYRIDVDNVGNIINVDLDSTSIEIDKPLFCRDIDEHYLVSHYDCEDLEDEYNDIINSYYYKHLVASDEINEKYRDAVKEVHDFEANLYKDGTFKNWLLHIIAFYTMNMFETDYSDSQRGWMMNVNLIDDDSSDGFAYEDLAGLLNCNDTLTKTSHPIIELVLPTKFKLSDNLENDVFHKFVMGLKKSIEDILGKYGWKAFNANEGSIVDMEYAKDQTSDYGPADGIINDMETFYYTCPD